MAVKPVPEGYHTLTPYLAVEDASAAIEFYGRAFDAKERVRMSGPGDSIMHCELEIGGKREEWRAEITHQEPDSHIAWRSTQGKENAGDVRFQSLGPDRTRVDVVMTWEPEGIVEATAEKVGRDAGAVKADLERFKELIESRGVESGAWRGEVVGGERID